MYVAAGSHVGYKYLVKKRPEEPSRSMGEFEEVLGSYAQTKFRTMRKRGFAL
jgi:hypothetical protein